MFCPPSLRAGHVTESYELRVERTLDIHSPRLQFLPARDSNLQPSDYESDSLTIMPWLPHPIIIIYYVIMIIKCCIWYSYMMYVFLQYNIYFNVLKYIFLIGAGGVAWGVVRFSFYFISSWSHACIRHTRNFQAGVLWQVKAKVCRTVALWFKSYS